jgi:lincosamide nucleotidyltransferase A/C/D/E
MPAAHVLSVLAALSGCGVPWWIDGGWGVDALLGHQTRLHDDLDLIVPTGDVGTCRSLLEGMGFAVERDWLPTALALRHRDGRAVDLHPVDPTADGGGDQVQRDGVTRFHYPPPVDGSIGGERVPCCSVACQVETHLGYEPDEGDRADMKNLADAFGLRLPEPYGGQR